ncbi:MAG: DNA-processing protein DprA [Thermoleophilaceae bacterium]
MSAACDSCLRRAHLIGFLAPWISQRLVRRERLAPQLLSLPDDELIAAAAPKQGERAEAFVEGFAVDGAREGLERAGVEATCAHRGSYPEQLRQLSDPPAVLFTTGTLDRLVELASQPAVAIVGARRCSRYAREVAYEMGRGLGAAGVTVVSGLALGIDAEAHTGTIDARGPAIAVLAGGADVPYPRSNRGLYLRIRRDGAVVSELPPGVRPAKWGFPARNRIMAGLAQISVIVEAAEKSGSLITADFATQLGRDVCAVPGHVNARVAAGSNRLLHEGAPIVRGTEDVLDMIFGVGQGPRPQGQAQQLDEHLQAVLDAVETGEGLDAISRTTPMSAADVRAALGRLELLGLVARDGLGTYTRTARG